MSEKSWPVFWGMTALAVALVIMGLLIGHSLREIRRTNDTITVTGSARRPIRSDLILWTCRVTERAATIKEAYQQVKRSTSRVVEYLRAEKVAANEITLQSITTNPLYQTDHVGEVTSRTLVGYELVQAVTIESHNVDAIAALSRKITDLIEEGVPLESDAPQYYFTKLSELRIQMLGEATKDAKQRAQTMVEAVGSRVGSLRSIRSGVFQITPRFSTEVSGAGENDTTALDKDITAVVTATFAVE